MKEETTTPEKLLSPKAGYVQHTSPTLNSKIMSVVNRLFLFAGSHSAYRSLLLFTRLFAFSIGTH
jgi:hypothetical protein